jgi:hypothetical protein
MLDNLRITAGLGLRLIGYFLPKMFTLLIQGIVQKRIVNMKGERLETQFRFQLEDSRV